MKIMFTWAACGACMGTLEGVQSRKYSNGFALLKHRNGKDVQIADFFELLTSMILKLYKNFISSWQNRLAFTRLVTKEL